MISVDRAEKLVLEQTVDFGSEIVPIGHARGRVLAQPIVADRDYPAGDRSTMDGIAIKFEQASKQRTYYIKAKQAAGVKPVEISRPDQCVQIMTGAILGTSVNTVIKIEDVSIAKRQARVSTSSPIKKGDFVHKKGSDKRKDSLVIETGATIGAKEIAVMASLGQSQIKVSKLPRTLVVTTGDELVDVDAGVEDYQTRRSNDQAISSVLASLQIKADRVHLPDHRQTTQDFFKKYAGDYDIIISTGGVSKGELDFVQTALDEIGAKKIFHGVAQRPGKPFWFGKKSDTLIFAFPGNAVSSFLCLHRYFVPWLTRSLGQNDDLYFFASLNESLAPDKNLTRFIPAKIHQKSGKLSVTPLQNNGSGDFISLVNANAFLEIPAGATPKKGQLHKIWRII